METDEYDKMNCTRINLKLNNKTDADIIKKLEDVDNMQGYIKGLIRKDEKYRIKPEYLDLWGDNADVDTIISGDELEMIASGGDKTIDEIIDQLELIDSEEEKKVKKTVYVVYKGSVEVKKQNSYDESVIMEAVDPDVLLVTEDKNEAIEYAEAKQPKMYVIKDMGMAVKYDLIEGVWVEEEIRTYDEDGDHVDTDDMGTWFISKMEG